MAELVKCKSCGKQGIRLGRAQIIIAIGIVLALVGLGCGDGGSRVVPPSVQDQLASIDAGHALEESDPAVRQFTPLLEGIEATYGLTPQQVGDQTVSAWNMLRAANVQESLIDLMKAMSEARAGLPGGTQYSEVLATYVTARENGASPKAAVVLLHDIGRVVKSPPPR
jgi:hypothetical protein